MAREIVLTVDIDAEAKEVFDALTTQEGLAGFWTPNVGGSAEKDAALTLGFAAAPVDLQMTVTALEPHTRVSWECGGPWPYWGGTTIEWRLEPGPESGTRVLFRHDGWADDYQDADFGSVAYTWALVLGALSRYASSGQPQPALQ